MDDRDDPLIRVRRHPNDWQTAVYRLSQLRAPHWSSNSGGVGKGTARPTIFGYVWCDAMLGGELAHSCSHGPPPHEIKVCVPKVANDPVTLSMLRAVVDASRATAK